MGWCDVWNNPLRSNALSMSTVLNRFHAHVVWIVQQTVGYNPVSSKPISQSRWMNWIVLCPQPTLRTIKCSDQIQTRKRERKRERESLTEFTTPIKFESRCFKVFTSISRRYKKSFTKESTWRKEGRKDYLSVPGKDDENISGEGKLLWKTEVWGVHCATYQAWHISAKSSLRAHEGLWGIVTTGKTFDIIFKNKNLRNT